MRGMRHWLLAVVTLMGVSGPLAVQEARGRDDAPLVAAASDLQFVMPEILTAFEAATGHTVRVSFGSSGHFTSQFRAGAPIALFLSADEELALDLVRRGLTEGRGALYARGRLALVVPKGGRMRADEDLADLDAAMTDGRMVRFAIANPEHAPYGARAREVLLRKGLWDRIQQRLVFGENVAQAAQFALTGAAQGGITAYAIALAPAVRDTADHALIPLDWHAPLHQRMVLARGAPEAARALFDFMLTAPARDLLARYGFGMPE